MHRDYPQDTAFDPRQGGPLPLWLMLAIVGVVLGSAALVAALAGSGAEVDATHFVLRKVSIL